MMIRRGTFQDILDLRPMFKEHWLEIGMANITTLELDLDLLTFEMLSKSGSWFSLVIEKDHKTIGYLSIVIYNHLHHRCNKFAITDCFYVDPKSRSFTSYKTVCRMFKMAEDILKAEFNVDFFQIQENINKDLQCLPDQLGYTISDVIYIKDLR